jgi:hypothetical protein
MRSVCRPRWRTLPVVVHPFGHIWRIGSEHQVTLPRPDQRIVVAVVYVAAMLMNTLDSTIVNVALATLGREFNVPR